MKLNQKEIQLHGKQYQKCEPMKYRFMIHWTMYPTLKSELIWDLCVTERGLSKRKVREKNAKARKPFWRAKRKKQRNESPKRLHLKSLEKRDA